MLFVFVFVYRVISGTQGMVFFLVVFGNPYSTRTRTRTKQQMSRYYKEKLVLRSDHLVHPCDPVVSLISPSSHESKQQPASSSTARLAYSIGGA